MLILMSPPERTPFVVVKTTNRIYLILFAPHAFVPQRQDRPSWLPSLLAFCSISTDFTPPPSIPSASNVLYLASFFRSSQVEPGRFNRKLSGTPTDSLRPVNSDNARGTRITATAGTSLVTPYSSVTVTPLKRGSSRRKAFYAPKSFFEHAVSLVQGFPHWPIFSTAASRRSRARVSVPLLADKLSLRLPVIALVGHYPTN